MDQLDSIPLLRLVISLLLLLLLLHVACRLTLLVMDRHRFLFSAILLVCWKFNPVHCRMLSLHCCLGLPLPRFPSTMPSSRLRCMLSCLIMCPKKDIFLWHTVPKSDLLTPAWPSTSSLLMCFFQLILSILLNVHISNASNRCCDVLLMVQVSIPYSNVDHT